MADDLGHLVMSFLNYFKPFKSRIRIWTIWLSLRESLKIKQMEHRSLDLEKVKFRRAVRIYRKKLVVFQRDGQKRLSYERRWGRRSWR